MARNQSMQRFAIVCMGACLVAACLFVRTDSRPPRQTRFRHSPSSDAGIPPILTDGSTAAMTQDFDWTRHWRGGWNEVRRAMKRIGITPTASYVGALQTNVTGGKDQVWSYAGQLSFAASADFGELIKIPGLSAYVGTSWGTGSDLAGSLDSTIPTSASTHPRSTWEKCTCSRSSCSRS